MQSKHGVQRIDDVESNSTQVDSLSLDSDGELSLEELSAAYSKLIGEPTLDDDLTDFVEGETELEEGLNPDKILPNDVSVKPSVDACVVSGKSILEAILFVGDSQNAGIMPESISAMMRGVSAAEIVKWIDELNEHYVNQGHAMRIVDDGQGYQMQLATALSSTRDSMYGKMRETQLNQAAIDCLSLVAYQPGVTRAEVEHLWPLTRSAPARVPD